MKQMPAPEADSSMEDLYKGENEEQGAGEQPPETIDQENQEEMSKTALVPLSVLMGDHTEPLKVGDEVVLKVKSIHGKEAMVEYSETPASEIGKEGGEGGEEMSPEEEIDSLNTY